MEGIMGTPPEMLEEFDEFIKKRKNSTLVRGDKTSRCLLSMFLNKENVVIPPVLKTKICWSCPLNNC